MRDGFGFLLFLKNICDYITKCKVLKKTILKFFSNPKQLIV